MQINIQTPINRLSYGIMASNIIKEMINLKVDVTIYPIGKVEIAPEVFAELMPSIQTYFDQSKTIEGNSLKIYHADDLAQRIGKGRHIGYTAFELTQFTGRQKAHISACDRIMTCSKWGDDILKENGFTHSSYAPLGVDRWIFKPDVVVKPENILRKSDSYVFLHVGKAEKRKSTLEIVEAFNYAFTKSDNVELWMCIPNIFLNEQEEEWWSERILSPKFNKLWAKTSLINRRLATQYDVAEIMVQSDAGVFPARSEGFNLPALEMLSCGKQVVATNYSAHTEFLSPANSQLVNINELEVADDGKWFKNGIGEWAKIGLPEIIQIAEKMKYLYNNVPRKTVNEEGIKTAEQFTWRKTAEKILGEFNE